MATIINIWLIEKLLKRFRKFNIHSHHTFKVMVSSCNQTKNLFDRPLQTVEWIFYSKFHKKYHIYLMIADLTLLTECLEVTRVTWPPTCIISSGRRDSMTLSFEFDQGQLNDQRSIEVISRSQWQSRRKFVPSWGIVGEIGRKLSTWFLVSLHLLHWFGGDEVG